MVYSIRVKETHMTNRKIVSNLSCYELVELCNYKPKAIVEKDLNLYEEMFGPDPYNERGQDSAFMDDNYGG